MGRLFDDFDVIVYWGVTLLPWHNANVIRDLYAAGRAASLFDGIALVSAPWERVQVLANDQTWKSAADTVAASGGQVIVARRLVMDAPTVSPITQNPAWFYDWTFYRDRLAEIATQATAYGGITMFDTEHYEEDILKPEFDFVDSSLTNADFMRMSSAIQRSLSSSSALTYQTPYGSTDPNWSHWPMGLLGKTAITQEGYTVREPAILDDDTGGLELNWPTGWYPYLHGWGAYLTTNTVAPVGRWSVQEFVNGFPHAKMKAQFPRCDTIMLFIDEQEWAPAMIEFARLFGRTA